MIVDDILAAWAALSAEIDQAIAALASNPSPAQVASLQAMLAEMNAKAAAIAAKLNPATPAPAP